MRENLAVVLLLVAAMMLGCGGAGTRQSSNISHEEATPIAAQDENEVLDPPTMFKGDMGKLPKTTDSRYYTIGRVIDDEVLVGVWEMKGDGFDIAARFFIRDAELVKKYKKEEKGQWLGIRIELPEVYTVVARKTLDGWTLPVLAKTLPKKK